MSDEKDIDIKDMDTDIKKGLGNTVDDGDEKEDGIKDKDKNKEKNKSVKGIINKKSKKDSDNNKKQKEKKSEKDKKNKVSLSSVLNDFIGEYKKIIWPSFKNLCKQTYTVIVTCLFFGAIIFCVDAAYGFCFEYMLNLLSSK